MEFCSTCASVLSSPSRTAGNPLPDDHRRVGCCARIICRKCIQRNERFARYCPYCQVSTMPSPLPQRLRDPPPYASVPSTRATTAETSTAPPPYTEAGIEKAALAAGQEREKSAPEDTLHFLNHDCDTIASLSLRYGVPAPALRRTNNITSDHLLHGRKTILIPGEYYRGGVSLSPRPVEGEEEELRKAKIRRFMTSCKVSDYDVALLYLEQSDYDLGAAINAFFDDDAWEKNHPRHKTGTVGMTTRGRKNVGPLRQAL